MFPVDDVLRLGIALLCGAAIGIEREWRNKNAGVKTNALVALGAAAFGMIDGADHRIAANVVTGIGFIGAGVIMHRGLTVQGVTTAATLWVNAAIALCIGLGRTRVGLWLFVGVMIVQLVMRSLDKAIGRARRRKLPVRVDLTVHCDPAAAPLLNEAIEASGVTVLRRTLSRHDGQATWRVIIVMPADLARIEERLAAIAGVTRVDARHAGIEGEMEN